MSKNIHVFPPKSTIYSVTPRDRSKPHVSAPLERILATSPPRTVVFSQNVSNNTTPLIKANQVIRVAPQSLQLASPLPNRRQESKIDSEVTMDFVISLAKQAGILIRSRFHQNKVVDCKCSANDLVTDTDVDVERFLMCQIRMHFPSHQFICEESSKMSDRLTDHPTWIIDPVDGTMNFVHTFPFTCVSIAFARNSKCLFGCIYNPIMDELFWASKGGGAYLNGTPIRVSGKATRLADALVSTGFSCSTMRKLGNEELSGVERKNAEQLEEVIIANTRTLMRKARDIRRTGAAACDLSNLAMGRIDIFFEFGLRIWDIAAGVLIVEEAGGQIFDITGKQPLDLSCRRILAVANALLAHELVPLLTTPPLTTPSLPTTTATTTPPRNL